jgi:hypothetical protein
MWRQKRPNVEAYLTNIKDGVKILILLARGNKVVNLPVLVKCQKRPSTEAKETY